jgi:hypothetical protein
MNHDARESPTRIANDRKYNIHCKLSKLSLPVSNTSFSTAFSHEFHITIAGRHFLKRSEYTNIGLPANADIMIDTNVKSVMIWKNTARIPTAIYNNRM